MRLRRIPVAKEAVKSHPLALQEQEAVALRGVWRGAINYPELFLEVGMGRSSFIIGQAAANPDTGYIGMEFREEMVYLTTKLLETPEAKEAGGTANNLRFIWGNAMHLSQIFANGELDRIYLNFSDPWPKVRHEKRRLTHESFLAAYHNILKSGGRLLFRTDNRDFFEWSLISFEQSNFELVNMHYNSPLPADNIISGYEKRYRDLGQPIYSAEYKKL